MKYEAKKNGETVARETQLLEDCVFLYGIEDEMEERAVQADSLPGELMGMHVGAHVSPMHALGFSDSMSSTVRDIYQVSLRTRELTSQLKQGLATFRSRARW